MEIRLPDFEIVDFHCHFPVPEDFDAKIRRDWIARVGQERWNRIVAQSDSYQEEWWLNWCFPRPETDNPGWEVQADRWAAEMDKYRISRIVWVTGGGNDLLSKIVARHPGKFLGFAHHDPCLPNAVEELERAITQLGFVGYKILAPIVDVRLDDRSLYPIWEVCERYQVPVLIHFGILGGGGGIGAGPNIDPLIIHDAAKAFPDLTFVVPHFGCGYVRELLQLAWACKNIVVDTSGNNEWVRWMPYELTLKDLFRRFYETIGPERIVFGTDSCWFPRGFAVRYLLDQIKAARELRIPESELAMIFGKNAMRLLKLT